MTDLSTLTLNELSKGFQNGEYSSREITESCIKNIEAKEKDLNVFITKTLDLAREMADAADSRRKNNDLLGPLDGMPFVIKDSVCTKGIRSTASSKMLDNFIPPYDGEVWKRLKNAGVVLLGKGNTDEFTMGSSTENSAYGVTKNPHDLTKVSGGSSGGPAAAIAANFALGAIATDTGGSIRQPGHFCGVTGLKVSYGRVSRWGTMPMASSLDTIGPMAKTAKDCALILQTIAGHDPKDSTTLKHPVPNYLDEIQKSISGIKIGVPTEYIIGDGIDPEILTILDASKEILKNLGAEVIDISLPFTKYAVAAYYIIAPSEISANLSRFDGIRFGKGKKEDNLEAIYMESREAGFGDEVKRRIMIGTYALSAGYYDAFYRKAQKVRTLVKKDFENNFKNVDAILCPVAPTPAFDIGKNDADPLQMYLEDAFTIPASLAGICGISTPVGKSKTNLPIGVQLLAPAFKEERVLRIAHQMEQSIQ